MGFIGDVVAITVHVIRNAHGDSNAALLLLKMVLPQSRPTYTKKSLGHASHHIIGLTEAPTTLREAHTKGLSKEVHAAFQGLEVWLRGFHWRFLDRPKIARKEEQGPEAAECYLKS